MSIYTDRATISRPRLTALSSLVSLGLLAAACSSDDAATEPGTDSVAAVTIYSGRNEELVQPILDRFEQQTGIEVEVKYDESSNLALLIEEEAAAGRNEADIFLSQSPGSMGFLEQNGRLAELPESTLDLVNPKVRDAEGRWIGITGRQRVLVYNTDLVDEKDLPSSVFDLIDQRWQGEIGIAAGNSSFQDFVTVMRATEGDEVTVRWLEDLDALDPVPYAKNSAIVASVGRGEIEIGLVNHYYNFLALEENPDLPSANHHFAVDDPGAVVLVTAAAIVRGTDRPDVAAQLIDFLLTEDSQRFFSDDEYEYPLALGVEPSGDLPALDFVDVGSFRIEALDGGLERTRELIADAGLEN
jgi:iron(III) transport system substrate-binding protein